MSKVTRLPHVELLMLGSTLRTNERAAVLLGALMLRRFGKNHPFYCCLCGNEAAEPGDVPRIEHARNCVGAQTIAALRGPPMVSKDAELPDKEPL